MLSIVRWKAPAKGIRLQALSTSHYNGLSSSRSVIESHRLAGDSPRRKLPHSSNVNCGHCGASHLDSNTAIVKANKQKISRQLINGSCSTLSSNGSLSNAVA